jgi:hypothetical protein
MKKLFIISIILSIAHLSFASGKPELVPCKFTLKNAIPVTVVASVISSNSNGDVLSREDQTIGPATYELPANSTVSVLKSTADFTTGVLNLPAHSKVDVYFRALTSSATYRAQETFSVPESTTEQDEIYSLTADFFDQASAKKTLESFSSILGNGETPIQPNYERFKQHLNDLIITDGLRTEFFSLPADTLYKVTDVQFTPQEIKNSAYIDNGVATNLDANIPLFGSLKNALNVSNFYNLKVDIQYFDDVPQLAVSQIIASLPDSTVKELRAKLQTLNANATIQYVARYRVIKSAIFSYCIGSKIEGQVSTAISSVFTANGSYHFDQGQEDYISLSDAVTKVEYNQLDTAGGILNFVNTVYGSPTTPRPTTTIDPSTFSSLLKTGPIKFPSSLNTKLLKTFAK